MRRLLLGFAALAWGVVMATPVHADATPVQLMLSYLPNVSNTETPSASGIAELVMPEGEVRISAAGLPRLQDADRYVAWLVNGETNQSYRLGSFNAKEGTDTVHYEDVLPDAIPNKQWNLLLLTIENSAEVSKPGPKHSIAGTFPRSERDPPPQMLPNTGGGDEGSAVSSQQSAVLSQAYWLPAAGLAALLASVAGGAGYVAGRRSR
jgi:hypothetical protein